MQATESISEVRRRVRAALEGHRVRVWLFGSQARGDAGTRSDIDVAILPLEDLPQGLLSELREALEESTVPQRVDLVDLREASPALKARVEAEGLPWIG